MCRGCVEGIMEYVPGVNTVKEYVQHVYRVGTVCYIECVWGVYWVCMGVCMGCV